MDYYNILGVNKNSPPEDIKKAYKKLAMKHHPDHGGDGNKFAKINEAYETLKDPAKKQQYDNPQPEIKFNTGNMNDIFSAFFGGGRPIRANPDVNISIRIDLEDVMHGKNILGRYTLRSGEEAVANLNIPSGIENGQIFQVKGLGENINPRIPRGNLNAKIIVLNHPKFERDRLHLRTKCSINVLQLILGTEIDLETLDKKSIKLKIPKGTNPGTIMSIAGYGIRDFRTNKTGNLYVEIKGVTPTIEDWNNLKKVKELYDETNNRS